MASLRISGEAIMIFRPFQKILIANRGEIACRIARTAKAMGYRIVAVFSDADANALHVRLADEAVRIGPPPPQDSYLNIRAILEAARKTGADTIHPGYGFLAENANFAEACEDAEIVFIGPSAEIIRKMGDKAAAKAIMEGVGVPCVPGYFGQHQSGKRFASEAGRLGFPLLIKAIGGGGGRGIRAVYGPAELGAQLAAARREAKAAFGDDGIMLERLIEHPRHLEVQIFGDAYGNIVHLFERDCTTQRRRQKIIEEAPSPVLPPALREKLTGYAVEAARAVGYRNAGAVEFIADADLNIYFLEVNARLQVEHPVTEMVTGLDLVEWQLRVAAGEPLPLRQDQISLSGHAIEARLCAEDPYDGLRPQTGIVLRPPRARNGVRVDSGVEENSKVLPYYDSMVAKVIAHGRDRAEAVRQLACVLEDDPLLGFTTNQQFLADLLRSNEFRQSSLSTDTLDAWSEADAPLFKRPSPPKEIWALATALHAYPGSVGEWFWSGNAFDFSLDLDCGGERKMVRYKRLSEGTIAVSFDGGEAEITLIDVRLPDVVFQASGVRRRAIALWDGADLHLSASGSAFVFGEAQHHAADNIADGARITAPVAGLILNVFVEPGQSVEAGQTLALIEAMKMETRVTAIHAGRIVTAHAQAGAQVAMQALLFEVERVDAPANV
jgi:geranyl-CoA carboxylase alpha subunit